MSPGSHPAPSLGIVVVTHESAGVVDACLTAATAVPDVEVVVVDNASTDDTVARVRAHGVAVHVTAANLGFARAANKGAALTEAELVCFLNPDCVITAEACAAALSMLDERTDACAVPRFRMGEAIVAGRQPGYTRTKLLADMVEAGRWRRYAPRLRARAGHHDETWHWPLGTCLFIPRRTFQRVGGFDESCFLYMEDVELGRSLAAAGVGVIELPHLLDHAGCAGSRISDRRRRRLLAEARIAYGRRHHGRGFAWLMQLVGAL